MSVYTPEKPRRGRSSDELRATIPGWGADLDPADRPSVPREQFDPTVRDAGPPESQQERWPRERSIEHARLTPVFGTSCPPRGLSGAIRRLAYARYSEARAAHWLLLLAADRIDSKEALVQGVLTGRPDNPIRETGVLSELRYHGLASRVGRKRADLAHHALDPVIVGGPWLLSLWGAYSIVRRVWRR